MSHSLSFNLKVYGFIILPGRKSHTKTRKSCSLCSTLASVSNAQGGGGLEQREQHWIRTLFES